MNILLINYRYFISGGPERYLFNIKNLLEDNGHNVIPFSIWNKNNIYNFDYFLSPIGKGSEIYFNEIELTPKNIWKLFTRLFYSSEAKRKVKLLAGKFQVDIAYFLIFLRWISPSPIDVLHEMGIPIAVRLSDFSYLCPEGHFLRDGKVCELCLKEGLVNSIKYKCVQNSFLISSINAIAHSFHKYLLKIYEKIDAFICPSKFTLMKMVEGGFNPQKLYHIPTFVDTDTFKPSLNHTEKRYILYFGRIAPEKDIITLLDAFTTINNKFKKIKLLLIGKPSDRNYFEIVQKKLKEFVNKDVILIKEITDNKLLVKIIQNSLFVVISSNCYENFPNSILEAYACGKPVVASNIGGIPELVEDGITGFLFEPGNFEDLAEKIEILLRDKKLINEMGINARKKVEREFAPDIHYQLLINLFNKMLNKRR